MRIGTGKGTEEKEIDINIKKGKITSTNEYKYLGNWMNEEGTIERQIKEIERKIIEFSELEDKIDLPLKTYSSGMIARLAFSSAIFQQPDILLLDEIFAAGDAGFIEKSHKIMKAKWNEVQIAIFVAHSIDEIATLCNKCFIMQKGEIIASGETDEMIEKYQHEILHLEGK